MQCVGDNRGRQREDRGPCRAPSHWAYSLGDKAGAKRGKGVRSNPVTARIEQFARVFIFLLLLHKRFADVVVGFIVLVVVIVVVRSSSTAALETNLLRVCSRTETFVLSASSAYRYESHNNDTVWSIVWCYCLMHFFCSWVDKRR